MILNSKKKGKYERLYLIIKKSNLDKIFDTTDNY